MSKDKLSPLRTRTITLITFMKECVEVFTATIEHRRIGVSFCALLARNRAAMNQI